MAETKTQSSEKPIQTKRTIQGRSCVRLDPVFYLTVLLTLLLLGSAIGHHMLSKGQLSQAVSKVQLSEITVEENGTSQPLGQWVYEKYLYNSVNLTPEYAGLAVAQPEMNDLLAQYATEYSDYLTRKTETMPKVEADDFADLMQEKMASYMEHETGIIFSEADRIALVKNMQSDLSAWNGTMEQIMGHGFNKVMLRFFMTRAGMITACVLLNAEFVVWLIFCHREKSGEKGKDVQGLWLCRGNSKLAAPVGMRRFPAADHGNGCDFAALLCSEVHAGAAAVGSLGGACGDAVRCDLRLHRHCHQRCGSCQGGENPEKSAAQ